MLASAHRTLLLFVLGCSTFRMSPDPSVRRLLQCQTPPIPVHGPRRTSDGGVTARIDIGDIDPRMHASVDVPLLSMGCRMRLVTLPVNGMGQHFRARLESLNP